MVTTAAAGRIWTIMIKQLLLAKMKKHIDLIRHISLTDKELCTWFQLLSLCEFYRFILWVLTNEKN